METPRAKHRMETAASIEVAVEDHIEAGIVCNHELSRLGGLIMSYVGEIMSNLPAPDKAFLNLMAGTPLLRLPAFLLLFLAIKKEGS